MTEDHKTIVLIEDDEDDRLLFRAQLRRHFGDRLIEDFDSAEAARAWLQDHESEVRVVFTDLKLPGQSGIDFARDVSSRIPVYVISSSRRHDDEKSAIAAGAKGYFSKPIFSHHLELVPELNED